MNKLNLDAFLHRLEDVTAIDEIHGLTLGLRDHYKIDHAVYHWVSADGEQYGFGSYPPEWAQHYVDQDYLRIDPVVIGCFQGANPINWKRLDWSSKAARVSSAMPLTMELAIKGIRFHFTAQMANLQCLAFHIRAAMTSGKPSQLNTNAIYY